MFLSLLLLLGLSTLCLVLCLLRGFRLMALFKGFFILPLFLLRKKCCCLIIYRYDQSAQARL
jgi:hypothetical protein